MPISKLKAFPRVGKPHEILPPPDNDLGWRFVSSPPSHDFSSSTADAGSSGIVRSAKREHPVLWRVHQGATPLLLFGDLLSVPVFYFLTVWLRFPDSFFFHSYPEVAITIAVIGVFFLLLVGGYDRTSDFLSLRYATEHIIAFVCIGIVAPLAIYTYGVYWEIVKPGRLTTVITIGLFLCSSILWRRLVGILHLRLSRGRTVLILGDGELAQGLYRRLRRATFPLEFRFFAVSPHRGGTRLIASDEDSPILECDLFGELANVPEIEAIVIGEELSNLSTPLAERLVSHHLRAGKVQSINTFCETMLKLVPLGEVSPQWIFEADLRLREQSILSRSKRFLDLVLGSLGLALSLPFYPLIALAIRLNSAGPVFFRQERVGLHGKRFRIVKFRTMTVDAGCGAEVTRVGAFLRKHRIDELPQFFNVLRGEMSFIGPRAEWTELVEAYEERIPHYRVRHAVRPGITGWAQVNYPYGRDLEDAREKLSYDLYYLRHFSFFLELSIILKTVYTVLRPLAGKVEAETPLKASHQEAEAALTKEGRSLAPTSQA
jgi:exopolysaccharide biosynthesis polyprenyl glycosylphosphotransferase